MDEKKQNYKHIILSGCEYHVGKQLGSVLKEDKGLLKFLTSPFMGGPSLTKEQLENAQEKLEKYCPGVNEEIKGFADEVGTDWRSIVYYYTYMQLPKGNCSHVAITPEISNDGNSYLARSYEFDWGEEPLLIESSIDGKYRHIGFACQLFGLFDGINEKGLSVTTSAGVIRPDYHNDGFVFPVVVRAILDKCANVDEAIDLFENMPFADYRNFVIMDHKGNAALIEAAAGEHYIKKAGLHLDCKYLYATNHYSNEILNKRYKPLEHSVTRYNEIQKTLDIENNCVSKQTLKDLLSKQMPDGLCCHYYEDGMGTMWSIIFNTTNITADICFGAPDANKWRQFDLTQKNLDKGYMVKQYEADLPNISAPENFWG